MWPYLLTKVLELEPGDTKSLFRRALARWRLGDCEEASEDLETILKASTLVSVSVSTSVP